MGPSKEAAEAAERHRRHAATFGRLVDGTPDWEAPTPVEGWVARDVVDHLVSWLPGFLAGGGVELPAGPDTTRDPVATWRHHAAAVQQLLEDPASDQLFRHPHAGELPLGQAIDRFYTTDVFLHCWDLARASGHPVDLDETEAAALLAGMQPLDELLRASGQYGPQVPVAADAPIVDRLVGFIGRDPGWRPGR